MIVEIIPSLSGGNASFLNIHYVQDSHEFPDGSLSVTMRSGKSFILQPDQAAPVHKALRRAGERTARQLETESEEVC